MIKKTDKNSKPKNHILNKDSVKSRELYKPDNLPDFEEMAPNYKGIELFAQFTSMADNRWSVNKYNFKDLVADLSEHDKEIIRSIDFIGNGELTAIGMLLSVPGVENVREMYTTYPQFLEMFLYAVYGISYDEIRHGLAMKELVSLVNEEDSFIRSISSKEVIERYCVLDGPFEDIYQMLVGLLLGEVTNYILYERVRDEVEHPQLRELIGNIAKDERRHEIAWYNITKKIVNFSPEDKENYIIALQKAQSLHQAEVGYSFEFGAKSVQKYFNTDVIFKISTRRFQLLEGILKEDNPYNSPMDLMEEHRQRFGQMLQK